MATWKEREGRRREGARGEGKGKSKKLRGRQRSLLLDVCPKGAAGLVGRRRDG